MLRGCPVEVEMISETESSLSPGCDRKLMELQLQPNMSTHGNRWTGTA